MDVQSEISYENDFYAWAIHNAELLKQGRLTEIDAGNISEELESMGKRDKRQLVNRLIVMLIHLLKGEFQADKRSSSWKGSIVEQRRRMNQLLEDSPSLNHVMRDKFAYAYSEAIKQASTEMGLDVSLFPGRCSYSVNDILNDDFFPGKDI